MATDFTLEDAEALRRSVGQIVRAVLQVESAAESIVPQRQIEALGFLYRDGAQSIASLARRRGVRHQSMSATVTELETQGLARRSPDPGDARGVLIELTPAGHQLIDETRRRRSSVIMAAVEQTLTADERAMLARTAGILDKLSATLPTITDAARR